MSDKPRPPAGQPYRVPPRGPVTAEQVAPLVADLGPGWKDCAQVQPWQDCGSALRYVVYSPSYMGTLLVCRFDLFSPTRWWHEGMQVGISGVTHWRLADEDDQDFTELDCMPMVSPPKADALAQLLHWWGWYRRYKGFDPE
ncbi:hypothetical protein [Pseudomonas sp. PSPC3-3]|uniref:hypothetical protein n=1 Tax=unclassified Pseudomonas TaxID=196821 RepID=UPI003CED4AD0